MVVLGFFLMISMYIISSSVFASVGFSGVCIFFFIGVFHENFFTIEGMLSGIFHKMTPIDPFQDISFWRYRGHSSTLYYTNKKDKATTGLSMIKVVIMPDKIHVPFNQFVDVLTSINIPYTYQVVHSPNNKSGKEYQERHVDVNSVSSSKIELYFSVYYKVLGVLEDRKISEISNKLEEYREIITAAFSSVYHFKVEVLQGNEIVNAVRMFITRERTATLPKGDTLLNDKKLTVDFCYKGVYSISLIIYVIIGMVIMKFIPLIIFIVAFGIIFSLLYFWWGGLFYSISQQRVNKNKSIILLDPFKDMEFFSLKRIPDCLFIHVDNRLLVGVKIMNLRNIIPPVFIKTDTFFRTILDKKIDFSYSLMMEPIDFATFNKEGFKYLTENFRKELAANVYGTIKEDKWMDMRLGINRTILSLSVSSYKYIGELQKQDIMDIEKDIKLKGRVLKRMFEVTYKDFRLESLKKHYLQSGLLAITLKNKYFRELGTHLNYLLCQGRLVATLTEIVDNIKRGVETRIAAEFNTPLHLENYITVGYTINTEKIEKETKLGFTFEQIRSMVITNGTQKERNLLMQKIISESIKAEMPSIYFDFEGDASRIIKGYKGTRYEDQFLCFKFAEDFTLNILNSEIPYDRNNLRYLNYVFDVFALVFEKDERIMEELKSMIKKSPEMDLNSISIKAEYQPGWEKSFATNSVMALISDLEEYSEYYFHTPIKGEKSIGVTDFISNDKTIIIDLSFFDDMKNKVFTSFIILSKLIHYIRTSNDYTEKTVILPEADIFFYNQFLDKKARFEKIEKFLKPLEKYGFGYILSASDVGHLHPVLFDRCQCIVAFRTTHKRSIYQLKDLLGLQEYIGTGMYNSSRRNAYQIEYLTQLKPNEFLIKRSDINQPFPGILEAEEIERVSPMTAEQVHDYMATQGYDLQSAGRRLIEQTKKTLFEKDLGNKIVFVDEVISFFEGLMKVDKIGNNHEANLKEQLKILIYPKASKINKNKKFLHKQRDDLYAILIRQGYLVENHPKSASGSETMRTSFKVGEKFEKALQDYFKSKVDTKTTVSVEVVKKESNNLDLFNNSQEQPQEPIRVEDYQFRKLLAEEVGRSLLFNKFKIGQLLNQKDYERIIRENSGFFRQFVVNLFKKSFNHATSSIVDNKDVEDSIPWLTKNKKIPFTEEQLRWILKKTDNNIEGLSEEEIKEHAKEINGIMDDFLKAIQDDLSSPPGTDSKPQKIKEEDHG